MGRAIFDGNLEANERDNQQSADSPGFTGLMGIFAGLCSVFALIVSVSEAWREHVQRNWPEATARIERCSVDPYRPFRSGGRSPVWYIECRIGYLAGADEIETSIRSRSTYSAGDTELMNQRVRQRRPDGPIVVHYDPAQPKTAVLTATDTPYAGPRTPSNLRLLLIAAIACAVLVTVARTLQRRRVTEVGPEGQFHRPGQTETYFCWQSCHL